eukprot:Clim_evm9s217 gene=Clim_evmTU9s217
MASASFYGTRPGSASLSSIFASTFAIAPTLQKESKPQPINNQQNSTEKRMSPPTKRSSPYGSPDEALLRQGPPKAGSHLVVRDPYKRWKIERQYKNSAETQRRRDALRAFREASTSPPNSFQPAQLARLSVR